MGALRFVGIVCAVILGAWALLVPDAIARVVALRLGDSVETFSWRRWGKAVVAAQLGMASAYCYLCFHGASSGYAIALLGAAAAIMALRQKPNVGEKVVWVFIIFCLLIMELIAIRNDHRREDDHFTALITQGLGLREQMTAMQRSASEPQKTPPVHVTEQKEGVLAWKTGFVSVDTDSPSPQNGQMFVNVFCINVSAVELTYVECAARMFIHNGPSESLTREVEENYFRTFLNDYSSAGPQPKSHVAPGGDRWTSAWGPKMTQELFNDLTNNRKVVVVVGRLSYRDAQGRHTRDRCEWLAPPVNTTDPSWHLCDVHN